MIHTLEELAMNAWPALQTLLCDGWVLRLANGYTKRANSVHPLGAPRQPLETQIATCEAIYRARGQRAVFKLTPASRPAELDAALAARGYRLDSPTSVQTVALEHCAASAAPHVRWENHPSPEWQAAFCSLSRVEARHQQTLGHMLANLVPAACFASLRAGDEVIACGMAVSERGFVGLFDIVVAEEQRRQGYGRQLVTSLLAWGREQGAHTAYLQVMLNNPPALRLYAGLGFAEVYRYWYRIQE